MTNDTERNGNDLPRHWHLDRRVPIALILALLLQSSGAIWWAASISGRVENNERSVSRLETTTETMRQSAQAQAIQLGRIEEQLRALRTDIGRMISAVERGQN